MAARKARKTTKKMVAKPKLDTSFETPIETKEDLFEKSKGRNKKLIAFFVILIVFAILYSFRSLILAATVNNKPIFRQQILSQLEKQSGGEVLDDLVTKSLVYQEANKKNVTVSQEELDTEIKSIEENFAGQDQKLDDLLALQGMTRKDLEERIKFQKLVEKMLESEIQVTDEEITKYMTDNKTLLPEGKSQDELKETVKQQLKQEKLTQQFQTWIANIKQSAKIRYFVKYE